MYTTAHNNGSDSSYSGARLKPYVGRKAKCLSTSFLNSSQVRILAIISEPHSRVQIGDTATEFPKEFAIVNLPPSAISMVYFTDKSKTASSRRFLEIILYVIWPWSVRRDILERRKMESHAALGPIRGFAQNAFLQGLFNGADYISQILWCSDFVYWGQRLPVHPLFCSTGSFDHLCRAYSSPHTD